MADNKSPLDLDFTDIGTDAASKEAESSIKVPEKIAEQIIEEIPLTSRQEDPIKFMLEEKDYILTLYSENQQKTITLQTCSAKEFHTWYNQVWPSSDTIVKDFEDAKQRLAALKYVIKKNYKIHFRTRADRFMLN